MTGWRAVSVFPLTDLDPLYERGRRGRPTRPGQLRARHGNHLGAEDEIKSSCHRGGESRGSLRGAEARKSDSCDNSFELHLDVFDPGMNNQDRGNQDEEGPSLSQPVPRGETQVKCPFCSISILPVQAASPTYLAEI